MSLSPRAHRRYVQEVLIDEAAKTADALVRVQLSKVAETPVASALRTALRTPKQVSEAALNVLPLPDTIKDSALAPARLLEELGEIGPMPGQGFFFFVAVGGDMIGRATLPLTG